MKNKILKITKSFLCVMLIVSMNFTSFSALNTVDGSIFVTKAEFDAALANFNSRLTNFESGVNSKIDSQVSSYLDRNGIWAGQEQEFLTDFTNAAGEKASLLFNNGNAAAQASWALGAGETNNMGFIGLLARNPTNYWRRFPSNKYIYASKKIVNNITKSGLCVASLKFKINFSLAGEVPSQYTCITTRLSDSSGTTTTAQKWFSISHFMTQEYHPNTNIPTDNAEQAISADECLIKLPSDTFGSAMYLTPEFESSDANEKLKLITTPAGTFLFLGFVRSGKPLYYANAMIGAQDTVYRLAGQNKCHLTNWCITGADIKVY